MTIVDAVELPAGCEDRAGRPSLSAATEFGLPATLSNALRPVAARHATTPCAVALAGYMAVLYRYSGQDELALADSDGSALGVSVADDPAFGTLLDQVSSGLPAGAGPAKLAAPGLALSVRDRGDTLHVRIEYDPGVFAPAAVARLRGHLVQLLDGAAADPGLRLSRLPLLTPAEDAEFERWNATHADYPADQLAPELIAGQAAATPDATALEFAGATLTYRELDERSSRLAHHLRALGVGPDTRVAVYLERSFDLVITLVAVLKAGGAYVPLDPSYPPARLAFMVSDAQAPVLVTHGELAGRLATPDATVVRVDTADLTGYPDQPPAPLADGSHLAYVIYTSGSTGQPKGTMNTHRGLANQMLWLQDTYRLTAGDAVLQKTACGFDVSVCEFFWPLMTGARLVIAKPEGHRDPGYLAELIAAARVTVAHFVPSMLRVFLEFADLYRCRSLRQVLCSGEALPADLASQFLASGLPAALDNLYGPTEAAIHVTWWVCRAGDTVVPIGRPIANTTTFVLDKHGNRVPVGVPGELYLGGVQLARGYLNRAELTAERFVADPFGAPGSRLYRTGDLARWREDGAIEYLGRLDHQVKLRGFRIELGEIESALRDHPDIADAAALLRADTAGEPIVAAYLAGRDVPPSGALREWLRDRLPDYMVPKAFLALDAMPLSPNGKLDRAALLAMPLLESAARTAYLAPRTDTERRLCAIWAEALGLDQVGVREDFLALGGHSLRAVRALSRVGQEFGVAVPLSAMFRAPTVEQFAAEEVEPRVVAVPDAPELRRRGAAQAPLSPAQRRLWFLHQLHPGLCAYHLPLAYRLDGPLDSGALRDAITEVMSRHQVLRARIVAGPDGIPVQVAEAAEPVVLPVTEVTDVTPELLRERLRVPFDLARGPLLRAELFQAGAQRHVLLIVVHHLVADAWTMSVLAAELSAAYSARVAGHPPALAELPLQYSDYALWQQEALSDARTAGELAYWTRQLAGISPLALPTDRPRPAVPSFAGRRACALVPAEVMERLRAVGRGAGATDFMIMVAGLQVLLRRYTGQEDVTVGMATADRQRPGLDRLAGFFVNTVVLRTDLSGDPSFAEALERVREVALQAYEHQDLPFERLVEEIAPERDMSRSPLFEVALSYLNTPPADLRLEGLAARELPFDPGTVRFDLDVFMRDLDGGIAVEVCYRTDLFDEPTIRRLLDHFLRLLGSAADQPQAPISVLSLSGPDELGELRELGSRPVTHPDGPLVHELVADWARRHPDAPAVTDARRTLTYGQLDAMADRLAAHLRDRGVGRDTLVAVLLERSAEFVVALLAVLKAGAAYLPLDPGYPDGRLADMLDDSRAPIVVTTHGLADRLAYSPEAVLRLDRDVDLPGAGPSPGSGQARAAAPGDLAYVIYTSGSTGRPKGVLIEHRGLLNLCHWHIREYAVTRADRGTLVAAQGFDASVWELWPYLVAGASVSVADETTRSDPELLTRWLIDQRATLTFLATPLAEEVLKSELAAELPVRAILTGGDQLRQRPRPGLPFVLVNHYGPTECTVVATAGPVTASVGRLGPPPIGRPVDNVELYLLDEHQAPVPRGVRGELYLGGVQLARGYLGRPELTAERFVPDPAGPPGSRLYRTGDLVRWRSDGQLEFLGRADRQIKIRGHRIEPGEIEARLRVHPAVAEALVVAHGAGAGRLVGYLIAAAGQQPVPQELRRWLRQWLPGYMIPAQFLTLPEFPMTASGKVDRSRLPAPPDEEPELAYAAPRDDVESAIAELFQKVLGRDRVGIYDDFFRIGGHSLLATRLTAGLRRDFGVDLPMRAIFDGPTVADLAVALVETALAAPAEPAGAALPLPSARDSSSS